MNRHYHYFCEACAVFGRGPACWNCGSRELERGTPRIDVHLDWGDENGTEHHCRGGGGRQPLLT